MCVSGSTECAARTAKSAQARSSRKAMRVSIVAAGKASAGRPEEGHLDRVAWEGEVSGCVGEVLNKLRPVGV